MQNKQENTDPGIQKFSFTERPTNPPEGFLPLDPLIELAEKQLKFLTSGLLSEKQREITYKNERTIYPYQQVAVDIRIAKINAQIAIIDAQIEKLTSLIKLCPLKPISIRSLNSEGNLVYRNYYSIADSAGGVTEKTCLISEDAFRGKLENLSVAESYNTVETNKISMDAILKHPKTEKMTGSAMDTEVQREAMGLEIARVLGFPKVTESTMVYHDTGSGRHPCLFVPFGNMSLLKDTVEESQYRSSHGRLSAMDTENVEDFGKYAAFFMLCSDPDFIGKECQNKGLAWENESKTNRQLYIFDQVFMTKQNLGLDRAFNLVPTHIASKLPNFIARHFMGRNKSVINDSSYEQKVRGALHLLSKKEALVKIFENAALANPKPRQEEAAVVRELQKDAALCRSTFNARIKSMEKLFPPVKDATGKAIPLEKFIETDANQVLLGKAMLVNQLLNKPKLYDKSGAPYKTPFFDDPHTQVKGITIKNDQVTLSFGRRFGPALSDAKKELLKAQGFKVSGNTATISTENLKKLNEKAFFKEQLPTVDPNHNYISKVKIEALAKTYHENSDKVIKILDKIAKNPDKITAIGGARKALGKLHIKNQGFLEHIHQCLEKEERRQDMLLEKARNLNSNFKTTNEKQGADVGARGSAKPAAEAPNVSSTRNIR